MPFIAIALIVAAAIGGGASVAAEHSLPGEALWGFKVHVNENVRAALSTSAEARANANLEAARERLSEAQTLAAQSKLSADLGTKIETNFESRADAVAENIAKLEADGRFEVAADVAARFQAMVAQHAVALAEFEGSGDTSVEVSLAPLLPTGRQTRAPAAELAAEAGARAAAEGRAEAEADIKVDTDAGVEVEF